MLHLETVQHVITYIEEHLTFELTFEEIAEQAGFSLFHFQKIFHALTKSTLKEYIRKRRLTEASCELIHTDRRIIEIAIDYQYQSQEAFTRAFKEMFGITPGKYRQNSVHYVMLQKRKLTELKLTHLNGGISVKPKIVNKEAFNVVGIRYFGSNQNNEIPQTWNSFLQQKVKIKHQLNPETTYGMCEHVSDLTDDSEFAYIACVEVDSLEEIPEGMSGKTVAANQYAVFTHKGSVDRLGDTYEYIYGNWFMKSDYERTEDDDFELYDQRFTNDENSEMEIFIPIRKLS